MYGAIIGDIVGSRFEFNNHRSKKFDLFSDKCFFTDDTVMTVAVADAINNCLRDSGNYDNLSQYAIKSMQKIGRRYPGCGWGGRFARWIFTDNPQPYNSWGNGAAMRVSPIIWAAKNIDECKAMTAAVTRISHNHPEGMIGAEATAVIGFMAKNGASKEELREYIEDHYYTLDFTIDGIRETYRFNESCQETVPQALECFLESTSFEDCIRLSISVGGDSDTLAAIAGSVAEAYYGVPDDMKAQARQYLDGILLMPLHRFNEEFMNS